MDLLAHLTIVEGTRREQSLREHCMQTAKYVTGIGNTSAQASSPSSVQTWSAHRGPKRAYVAVAHSMLIAIYHILKDGVIFKDLGADYYNQFNKERKINAYFKKLKALGWESPVVAA